MIHSLSDPSHSISTLMNYLSELNQHLSKHTGKWNHKNRDEYSWKEKHRYACCTHGGLGWCHRPEKQPPASGWPRHRLGRGATEPPSLAVTLHCSLTRETSKYVRRYTHTHTAPQHTTEIHRHKHSSSAHNRDTQAQTQLFSTQQRQHCTLPSPNSLGETQCKGRVTQGILIGDMTTSLLRQQYFFTSFFFLLLKK